MIKKTIFILLTLTFFPINISASEILFLTHSLQDQVYTDDNGILRGKKHAGKRAFNLEVVREMMVTLNHPVNIREVPFVRGVKMVRKMPNPALFNVSRTPEREDTVQWVGPQQRETDYFYEMKKAPTGIKTLEDAKKSSEYVS